MVEIGSGLKQASTMGAGSSPSRRTRQLQD